MIVEITTIKGRKFTESIKVNTAMCELSKCNYDNACELLLKDIQSQPFYILDDELSIFTQSIANLKIKKV